MSTILAQPVVEEAGIFSITSPLRRVDNNSVTPLQQRDLFQTRGTKKREVSNKSQQQSDNKKTVDYVVVELPPQEETHPDEFSDLKRTSPQKSQHNYSFNENGFISAILEKNLPAVQQFLEKGISANARNQLGQSALSAAVNAGQGEIAQLLLSNGADPNTPSKRSAPPVLFDAISLQNIPLIQLLLAHGAQTDITDKNGKNILHQAIYTNNSLVVLSILKTGISPNLVDSFSTTSLLSAVQKGNPEIVFILLKNGGDFTLRDFRGISPLLSAVSNRHYEVLKMLLEAGANANETNLQGTPALHIALKYNYTDIANLLLAHGATPPAGGIGLR